MQLEADRKDDYGEGVSHMHCPYDHEKPQPFRLTEAGRVWYCGKCWHDDKELVECVPCTPNICD